MIRRTWTALFFAAALGAGAFVACAKEGTQAGANNVPPNDNITQESKQQTVTQITPQTKGVGAQPGQNTPGRVPNAGGAVAAVGEGNDNNQVAAQPTVRVSPGGTGLLPRDVRPAPPRGTGDPPPVSPDQKR